MNLKIKVTLLDDGGYMASVDWSVGSPTIDIKGTPGTISYADSAGEAYEIQKSRLESKGHTIIED